MKTFIINLDHAKERWETVCKQFYNEGIQIIRVPGLLGKNYKKKENFVSESCFRGCPYSILGVSVSHYRAWKLAREADSIALICEDDIVLEKDFIQTVNSAIREAPLDWDILWLGCLFCENVSFPADLALKALGWKGKSKSISKLLWIPPFAFGAHCYIVSENGVRKLLKIQINEAIDITLNRLLKENKLNGFALKSPIAKQRVEVGVSSMTTNFPSVLNKALDHIYLAQGVSLAYGLSYPLRRINFVTINGWSLLFFVMGALSAFFSALPLLLSFPLLDFAQDPTNCFFAFCFFGFGFIIAFCIKNSIK